MPFRFPHDIAKPQCVVVPLNKEAISPPEIALYKVPQPLELLLYSVKTLSLLGVWVAAVQIFTLSTARNKYAAGLT